MLDTRRHIRVCLHTFTRPVFELCADFINLGTALCGGGLVGYGL